MARNLDQMLDALTSERRAAIEYRAAELSTLKDLRQAMHKTQEDEAMGGKLELVASFPNRPPVIIEHLTGTSR